MHPRLRLWLIVAFGVAVGVVVSFGIAQQNYALAALLVAAITWLFLEWLGGPRPEAWLLALALVGNIVGNRGFAQLSLTPQLPLLPAEAVLLVGVFATLLRMAFRRTAAVARDPLNYAILVWMLLGAARLWPDVRTNGAIALRDFATVYYALFFFIGQALARHPASARLIRKSLLFAFTALPVTYFLFSRFPGFFLETLLVRRTPLIFYKDDLVAAFFFAGFFLILTTNWPVLLRGAVAVAGYASAFTIQSSRAAIVALVVGCGWWAVARRWAPWKLQTLAVPLALGALALTAMVSEIGFKQSRLYTLFERMGSIVDFSGTGNYGSEDRRYMGDNNRFRVAWWHSVATETWAQNPVFGLGFGYDLTDRFVRTYDFDLGEEFNVRSPHSILFTVLGRMGLTGLTALLAMIGAMAVRTFQLARRARTNDSALPALGWWSVSWVIFTSGCFCVVLDGPMGAVTFWTALGLANATSSEELKAANPIAVLPAPAVADLRNAPPAIQVTSAS